MLNEVLLIATDGTGVSLFISCSSLAYVDALTGPILMTVGPWKPILLEAYHNRITDLDIRSDVSESLDATLSTTFSFAETNADYVSFVLKGPDGAVQTAASKDKIAVTGQGSAKINAEFKASEIQLWYPVGYGAQPLYTVEVELLDKVCKMDT
jgi:beta-mannosidase